MRPRGNWHAWRIKDLHTKRYTTIGKVTITSICKEGKPFYVTPQEDDEARNGEDLKSDTDSEGVEETTTQSQPHF